MKKIFLYAMLVAAGALTSCSSEDAVNNGGQSGESSPSYLSVNIVSTTQGGGRAADSDFEDGTDAENKVSKVRFYFFDKDGNAVTIKKNATGNYYDWTNPDGNGSEKPNVEKKLNAVLVINTKEGDALPAQIVAVVNPTGLQDSQSYSLKDLREQSNNYSEMANEDGTFVMCNSVYANAMGEEVSTTKLTADNFQSTADDATKKPVSVYVERNVAKVRVSFDAQSAGLDGNNRIQAKTSGGTPIQVGGKNVYVQFGKWDITANINYANLSKHINPAWSADFFGAGMVNWNDISNFRSYWASALVSGDTENQYTSYNQHNKAKDLGAFKYCNENAELWTNGQKSVTNTKVIIPATLVDADGKALTVYEFATKRYVDNADLAGLKAQILTFLNNTNLYYKKSTGNAVHGDAISASDITFELRANSDGTGKYFVYPILSDKAGKDWVRYNPSTSQYEPCDPKAINDDLGSLPHIKVWNGGATYYFFDITHFNNKLGVVRNHLYDAKLTAIYGLGTPVFDPTTSIIPEKPTDSDTYVAAQVKILSWRVVPNNVTLDWGN